MNTPNPEPAILTTVRPDDPALAVKIKAQPPVVKTFADGGTQHGDWTLDLLERTLFEMRAAGAWDKSKVTLSNGSWRSGGFIECEVLAQVGEQAMPWGWRPSQGPPPPPRYEPLPDPVVPEGGSPRLAALLGNRVLHGLLLLTLLVLAVLR